MDGKFSKTDIKPIPIPVDPSIDLSKTYLYKITIQKLELNKAYMDNSEGYLESLNKKLSNKFIHEEDEHTIELKHICWAFSAHKITYYKEIKSLFKSKKQ